MSTSSCHLNALSSVQSASLILNDFYFSKSLRIEMSQGIETMLYNILSLYPVHLIGQQVNVIGLHALMEADPLSVL